MEEYDITIIIAVYNNEEDILNAIKSVLEQTYNNWKLIIVDDCSTDATYYIIDRFLQELNDSRIKFIRNMKNVGRYISINEILDISDGNYIAFLDSDDRLHPKKLELDIDTFKKYKNIIATITNAPATLMFKKHIIKEIGYFDSVRFGADSEFIERIQKKYGIKSLLQRKDILYYIGKRKNSLTRSKITGNKQIRTQYVREYREWHETNKLYIPYPMIDRPFPIHNIMKP